MMSDLINRQDAIDALTEANIKRHMDSVGGGQENRSAIRIIMELPSAERKRGEWIYKPMKGQFCSVCDMQSVWQYNYCPNCGAEMKND